MATPVSKEVVSGVGARYGAVFNLDSNGLPLPATTSAVPVQGSLIQGIKTLTITDPESQRITHYGEDQPFAQDSLPATEAGSFQMTTAKTNLILDAMVEGNKIRTLSNLHMRGGNSSKKGSEPLVFAYFYRQALDTTKGSATFGKLRQWQLRLYPSTRLTPQTESFEQGATDKTYQGTPTPVASTPWGEIFNEANWGQVASEYVDFTTDYQPRINTYLGNGVLTAFQLSHPPVTSDQLHVFVDGTVVSPSAVNVSATNPAFTLTVAPGSLNAVFAIVETTSPGNT